MITNTFLVQEELVSTETNVIQTNQIVIESSNQNTNALIQNNESDVDETEKIDLKPETRGSIQKAVIYTVKKNDVLSRIAKKYKVTVSQIKKWNHLKSDKLKVGQKLKIGEGDSKTVSKKKKRGKKKTMILETKLESANKFINPVHAQIIKKFENKGSDLNPGLTYGGKGKQKIVASMNGKVSVIQNLRGYGLTMIIEHDHGLATVYTDLFKSGKKVSDTVKAGEHIADVDFDASGSFHFEIRKNGIPVNPLKYLK